MKIVSRIEEGNCILNIEENKYFETDARARTQGS